MAEFMFGKVIAEYAEETSDDIEEVNEKINEVNDMIGFIESALKDEKKATCTDDEDEYDEEYEDYKEFEAEVHKLNANISKSIPFQLGEEETQTAMDCTGIMGCYQTDYIDFDQIPEPRFLPFDHEERLRSDLGFDGGFNFSCPEDYDDYEEPSNVEWPQDQPVVFSFGTLPGSTIAAKKKDAAKYFYVQDESGNYTKIDEQTGHSVPALPFDVFGNLDKQVQSSEMAGHGSVMTPSKFPPLSVHLPTSKPIPVLDVAGVESSKPMQKNCLTKSLSLSSLPLSVSEEKIHNFILHTINLKLENEMNNASTKWNTDGMIQTSKITDNQSAFSEVPLLKETSLHKIVSLPPEVKAVAGHSNNLSRENHQENTSTTTIPVRVCTSETKSYEEVCEEYEAKDKKKAGNAGPLNCLYNLYGFQKSKGKGKKRDSKLNMNK